MFFLFLVTYNLSQIEPLLLTLLWWHIAIEKAGFVQAWTTIGGKARTATVTGMLVADFF